MKCTAINVFLSREAVNAFGSFVVITTNSFEVE
jgi:hypothetical protein